MSVRMLGTLKVFAALVLRSIDRASSFAKCSTFTLSRTDCRSGDTTGCSSQRQPLTACVRLQIENRVVGAILVFRLLEHKAALQPIDFELIEMLGVHASVALYCASLHARPW